MRRKKGFWIVIFILGALFGLSWVVMMLWNFAVVHAFSASPLTYWQAMALLVLSKILFAGFRGRPGPPWARHRWKSRWSTMSEEEKGRIKEEWRQRCGPRQETNDK